MSTLTIYELVNAYHFHSVRKGKGFGMTASGANLMPQ